MKGLLRWLIQIDAHERAAVFAVICTIVGVMAALQHSDQKSNELWAKERGTAVATKE